LIFNVDKARSQGVELEVSASPNDHLDLSLSAGLNDSKLRSTVTSTDTLGNVSVVSGIKKGNRLPGVARVQISAAATYGWPVRQGSRAFVTASLQHVGSRYTQINDLGNGVCLKSQAVCPFGTVDMTKFQVDEGGGTIGGPLTQPIFRFNPELPAYTLVNLRAGLTRADWEIAVFLNNVSDERAFLALDRERGTRARVGYLTNQPRTGGVTLRFSY
jgi:iron complex outermembrane receptor protein